MYRDGVSAVQQFDGEIENPRAEGVLLSLRPSGLKEVLHESGNVVEEFKGGVRRLG